MVVEELPNELSEIFGDLSIKLGLTQVGFVQGLPISLFIVLVDVLVEQIAFRCFLEEGHHTSYHHEKNHTQREDVGRIALVGLSLEDLRGHVALSSAVRIENSNHAALLKCLGKSEVANLQIELTVNEDVFQFKVSMDNFLI